MHMAKCLFAECQNKGTRQNTSLPSARKRHSAKTHFAVCRKIALGKDAFCRVFFLPSVFYLALGKDRLCRVPDKIHSAKPPALDKVPVSGSAGSTCHGPRERSANWVRSQIGHSPSTRPENISTNW